MADQYSGPNKWLYGIAGWFIGNTVAGLTLGLLSISAATLSTPLLLLGTVAVLGASACGAMMGWNKAVRGQQEAQEMQAELAYAQTRTPVIAHGHGVAQDLASETPSSTFTDKIQPQRTQESYAEMIAEEKAKSSHLTLH